ncbi:flagellar hook-basal body complex protein FliE [Palleronia sp. LCG004]|uniref:flagellar hook-basal body complex protein FliE n=1 Tax=Palleronia sp. LCG004 TaxID=3079304 RepID=UPI00294377AC|nr:flagellar hook-basal body complex protein FliE [Palleronia sp. LCG004]WOI56193.1 flagellar hook-basal body complex protein FliE [Palleronia sp. LCG004]
MDINAALAAQRYTASRPATAPDPTVEAAGAAASDFMATLQKTEETAKAALVGQADTHALVQAMAESKFAVDTAVTVRDKVVEAYQEILRMPV